LAAEELGTLYEVEVNVTATPPGVTVGHYLLIKSASRLTVRAFTGGMLSVLGHSPTFGIRGKEDTVKENLSLRGRDVAGGTLKLRDELKFAFDIVARKQE
jgi:hypothetical protein